jgi:hypothetical protein
MRELPSLETETFTEVVLVSTTKTYVTLLIFFFQFISSSFFEQLRYLDFYTLTISVILPHVCKLTRKF